jgi:polyhydroxybutyrate depolymerase
VLVLFHGFSSNPAAMLGVTGLDESAPDAGVVLVAPLATGEPSSWELAGNRVDDFGFVDAILTEVRSSDCVDPRRVWVAGNSAGSAFSAIYACKRPGTVEGMGLNAGLAPAICPAEAVTQMLVFNGTADPVVSFDGGPQPVGSGTIQLDAIPDSVEKWAQLGGCTTDAVEERLAPDVRTLTWSDCPGTTQVTLHVLEGHGHNWPGAPPAGAIGPVNQTLDASCLLLHRMTRQPGLGYDECVDADAEALQ